MALSSKSTPVCLLHRPHFRDKIFSPPTAVAPDSSACRASLLHGTPVLVCMGILEMCHIPLHNNHYCFSSAYVAGVERRDSHKLIRVGLCATGQKMVMVISHETKLRLREAPLLPGACVAELGFDPRRLTLEAGSTSALPAFASPHSFPCWDESFNRTRVQELLCTHQGTQLTHAKQAVFKINVFLSFMNMRFYFHTLSFNCLRIDVYSRKKKTSHRTQREKQILVKYFVKSHWVLLPKQPKIIKFLCIL